MIENVDVMSLKEWRKKNKIGRNTAYKMVKDGLPVYRPGGRKMFVMVDAAFQWINDRDRITRPKSTGEPMVKQTK